MSDRTTYVVMHGPNPIAATSRLDKAKAAAITADTRYLGPDRQREHRWDPTDYPASTLVLRTKSLSTGRWVQTGYTVVPVPHTN